MDMFLKFLLITGLLLMSANGLAKSPNGKTVPVFGIVSGYLLGFNEDPDVIAERCNPPAGKFAWAVTSFEGWGDISHLGYSYLYAEHCSYGIEGIGPDGTYGEGEITTIADNGDILLGTYTNGISLSGPPIIGFMDDFTFVNGGTGRFTYASGGGVEMGWVDFGDFSFTVHMSGVIAYKRK
jgi:hypothetical protein